MLLTSGGAPATPTLSALPGWAVLVAIGLVILLSGLVIIYGRVWLEKRQPKDKSNQQSRAGAEPSSSQTSDSGGTLVRSWIAISLVGGLLVFCAAALGLADSSLRSTLFGGLVTSVGAAVAFYFSSKTAEQARQDVLSASVGTTEVPNLARMTVNQAYTELAKTPLQLVVNDPNAAPADVVTRQSPSAGANVRNGSKVSIDTSAAGTPATGTPATGTPAAR